MAPAIEERNNYDLIIALCFPTGQSNILIHLSVRLSVEVLKPRSLLKLSPRTRGLKNYSESQSHTFTFLLIES